MAKITISYVHNPVVERRQQELVDAAKKASREFERFSAAASEVYARGGFTVWFFDLMNIDMVEQTMRYRVAWQSKKDPDFCGHGRPSDYGTAEPSDYGTAEPWVKLANEECPDLHHWVEEVPDDPPELTKDENDFARIGAQMALNAGITDPNDVMQFLKSNREEIVAAVIAERCHGR